MRGVRSDSLVRFEFVILLWQITVMWCVDLENLTIVGFPAILTMGIVRMSVIVDCIAVLIILD